MILIKNCLAISTTIDQTVLKNHDILITGNIIEKIAKNIEPPTNCHLIDACDCVVVPGFVNTHHHFYQTLTRNIPAVQNAKLFDWLIYLYEIWKNIDEEAVFYSSLLAMGELLKTGCTTSTDHHYLYPKHFKGDLMSIQFEAAEKLGMRFSPTRGSMSLSKKDGGLPPDSVVQTEEEILENSEAVILRHHDSSDFSMKKIILAPCSPFSVSKQLMKESALLARKHGVRLHTHLAETEDENSFCEKIYGVRPLKLMEECDFIGADVSYAHGIHFNEAELELLKETQTHIAHCPTSNMRLGSGICKVKEMLAMDINVALAVDGSASNDSSDFLGEMRNALFLQRVLKGADALQVKNIFKMATVNGAKLLNFNKIGKIQEGWAADLALFNINKLEYSGSLSDPIAALLFCGYNHGTEYTIVNGKVVVEKGKLTGFNEQEIIKHANQISKKITHC
ncbi:MAG: 8-oxoguanine deaminase [Deltaproteobacteria bacterium]|jgi:8-oxoguanine deaminase|nr:8-oxoguanine deaminase [Deltaproteobacteria bacterium]